MKKNVERENCDEMKYERIQYAPFTAVIDSKGGFVFINSNLQKALHSNGLTILHQTFFDFIDSMDLEKCRQAIAYTLLTRLISTIEIRLTGPEGRLARWTMESIGNGEEFQDIILLTGKYTDDRGRANGRMQPGTRHYERILENLGIGLLLQDSKGVVLAANQKTAELFNVTLEDIYHNKSFEHLWKATAVNKDPIPFENSPPMNAFRKKMPQTDVLIEISGQNGDKRQVVMNSLPPVEEEGQDPDFIISSLTDLSEEKKLQALCETRKALFTSFMDHSPSFAWIVDEKENLIYANRGLLDYFGADKRALGRNIYEILPEFIADSCHEKHKWVLENNLSHSSILKSTGPNGDEQIFHVTTFPATGEEGAEKMIGGQAWYITDSYKAKLELKKTNERLLYLSRASSESIWDWNMETGQIYRNQALLDMIGYHDENPSGLNWWYRQIHEDDRKRIEKKIERVLAGGEKAWEQEYRFLCSDGSYKIVLDRGFVVYNGAVPIRMVGSLQDVSEIKQLEGQLIREKLKQQQQIAEAIFQAQERERTRIGLELHDNVNQILFTSKLYLELIKPTEEAEKEIKNKIQGFILLAIEEIRKLSKDLVSPPLQESGLIRCINKLITDLDIVDPFKMEFNFKDGKAIESINYHIKITLFRIIQEQVKNIIKHSQARKVSMDLSLTQDQVTLQIEDDGIGFDPRQTKRGIGLSNIFQRTKLYNGKVNLKTQPGQGCRIKVTIPI